MDYDEVCPNCGRGNCIYDALFGEWACNNCDYKWYGDSDE